MIKLRGVKRVKLEKKSMDFKCPKMCGTKFAPKKKILCLITYNLGQILTPPNIFNQKFFLIFKFQHNV